MVATSSGPAIARRSAMTESATSAPRAMSAARSAPGVGSMVQIGRAPTQPSAQAARRRSACDSSPATARTGWLSAMIAAAWDTDDVG